MKYKQPNVLFIMTDQQRWDTLSCNGNNAVSTPHLDRIAEEGAAFDHFYVNNPICVPSRCSFLTGRYPNAHKSRDLEYGLDDREIQLFQIFQNAGYRTGLLGKNHALSQQALSNFDAVVLKRHQKTDMPQTGKPYESFIDPIPAEHYLTRVIGLEAHTFIEASQRDNKPFCLWVSFPDPHTPFQVPEPYASKASKALIDMPIDRKLNQSKPESQKILHDIQGLEQASEEDIIKLRAIYYGMVMFIDEIVGEILGKIQELDLDEDTIIIFTSDHGEYIGDHGLVRKSCHFYDCLLRVPFMMRWKNRIKPQRISNTMAESIDLLPTLLDLIGIDQPESVQGVSMEPVLMGRQAVHKEAVYAEVGNPKENKLSKWQQRESIKPLSEAIWKSTVVQGTMIRTMDWKLCLYGNGEGELYDLKQDPNEINNVYNHADYMEKELEMAKLLARSMMKNQDPNSSCGDRMGAGKG